MRILIDTNVLLRSVEPGHLHYQNSVDAIDILRRSGHELAIVPQVLYEFWSVATRPLVNNGLGMSPADAHTEIAAIRKLFRLLRDERGLYSIWEQLVLSFGVKGKQAHDARLAAAIALCSPMCGLRTPSRGRRILGCRRSSSVRFA